MLLDDQIKEN